MAWKINIEGSAESGGTIGRYTCRECGKSAYATEFPRYFEDEKGKWHDPYYCPWCGSDQNEHEDGWMIAEVIIYQLQKLIESYKEWKEDGSPDDYYWWKDEYGGNLTDDIDCHVVFEGEPPCLIEERGLSHDPKNKEERCARDDACAECKAIWLMGIYE